MEYAYEHFSRSLLRQDLSFGEGPKPGDTLPAFDLPTADGGRLRKSDLAGRPALLNFGSITCPMTRSATPALKRLHRKLGDRVAFVTVYVREAHPGDRYRQPTSFDEKLEYARDLVARDRLPWPVAVDDLEGSFHRSLDPKPNSAYLVDADGRVVFRALWANDLRAVRKALRRLLRGDPRAEGERVARLLPMLRGAGVMRETLGAAGPTAKRDFRRHLLPAYTLGTVAAVFRPLPPLGRAVAGLVTMLFAVTAAGVAAARVLGRREGWT